MNKTLKILIIIIMLLSFTYYKINWSLHIIIILIIMCLLLHVVAQSYCCTKQLA